MKSWPWDAVKFDAGELAALQAVKEGRADQWQQRAAWRVIVEKVAHVRRMSFTAGGLDGQRATDFMEGRRWVGGMLERATNMELPVDPRGEPPPMPADEIPLGG